MRPSKVLCGRLLLVVWCCGILTTTTTTAFALGSSSSSGLLTAEICQNKDCCRQWTTTMTTTQSLPETLQDLLPPDNLLAGGVQIQVTGCLSQCGKGPNLVLHHDNNKDRKKSDSTLVHGVTSPVVLAQVLHEHWDIHVPSKLLAAVSVMEKARKGMSCLCVLCHRTSTRTATILESPACKDF